MSEIIKLSQIEHILLRPGMYIGSLTSEMINVFVVNDVNDLNNIKLISKQISYNPGFIKLFDEIITNAADLYIKTGQVKNIKITVNKDNISVENDGPGIPVEKHKKEKVYNPELIFGHLLTGTNFDDTEDRKWGGMNGIGAKLVNIYSKKFIIETADGKNKYVQEFSNNLSKVGKPTITKNSKNYTKITYYPDFDKFGLTEITNEIQQVLLKRSFDIAVYCPKVKVTYNNKVIPVKSFKDYMSLHLEDDSELYYEKLNDDWEIGVALSNDGFQQVSMVNGISTHIGGTHVNYITNQIIKCITEGIEKKYKKLSIKSSDIKNKLFIFLNSKVINPEFDTQSKENLITKLSQKDIQSVNISDKLSKQLLQSNIVEDILKFINLREQSELKNSTKKKVKIKKLDDANFAGTSKSKDCRIFIAEGDCLIENTLITIIRDGDKLNIPIKDVKIDDAVITHNNNIGIINGISKKIEKSVNIKLKNGEIIICSEKHRWYVYDKKDNKFIFLETKKLDKTRHKMIINKNTFYDDFIKILEIEKCKIDKFDYILTLSCGEIYSSMNHKFSVFNTEEYKFDMIECEKLNKNIHLIVSYEKI
jgi:DNA topoisomerase-2